MDYGLLKRDLVYHFFSIVILFLVASVVTGEAKSSLKFSIIAYVVLVVYYYIFHKYFYSEVKKEIKQG